MLDETGRKKLKVVLAQVRATEEILHKLPADQVLSGEHPAIETASSLTVQAREILQGTGLETLVPHYWLQPWESVNAARAVLSNLKVLLTVILEEEGGEVAELKAERDLLKGMLAEAGLRAQNIVDDQLRDRCLDLLLRPDKADTAVREACVLLEDRIRDAAGLPAELIGADLVTRALHPENGILMLSEIKAEQEAILLLYRGVIGFFKNPTSHRIIENYDLTRARQVVGLIDLLLNLLRDAKRRSG